MRKTVRERRTKIVAASKPGTLRASRRIRTNAIRIPSSAQILATRMRVTTQTTLVRISNNRLKTAAANH
jgi:hypothetical protein